MTTNKRYLAISLIIVTFFIGIYTIQIKNSQQVEQQYDYEEDEYEKFLQEKVLPDMIRGSNGIQGCELEESMVEKSDNIDLGSGLIEIDELNFIDKLEELHANFNKYIGREITYEGIIYKVENYENPIYVVGRYIKEIHGDHEHENFFGLQGIYEGQWPEADTWIKVKGKVSTKEFNGEVLPAIDIEELVVQEK